MNPSACEQYYLAHESPQMQEQQGDIIGVQQL